MKYIRRDNDTVLDADDESGFCIEVEDAEAALLIIYRDGLPLQTEKVWVSYELALSDRQINYLEDGDTRAVSDIATWRQYRKDLRDRIIAGVIDPGARPTRPV